MDSVKLTVFGEPRTKSNRAPIGKNRRGEAHRYKHRKDRNWEKDVRKSVLKSLVEREITKPVFPRDAVLRASFKFYFSRRPTNRDVQNYFKSVCDALEGLVYLNDSQLISVFGEKFHDKEKPRIEVKVWRDEG